MCKFRIYTRLYKYIYKRVKHARARVVGGGRGGEESADGGGGGEESFDRRKDLADERGYRMARRKCGYGHAGNCWLGKSARPGPRPSEGGVPYGARDGRTAIIKSPQFFRPDDSRTYIMCTARRCSRIRAEWAYGACVRIISRPRIFKYREPRKRINFSFSSLPLPLSPTTTAGRCPRVREAVWADGRNVLANYSSPYTRFRYFRYHLYTTTTLDTRWAFSYRFDVT